MKDPQYLAYINGPIWPLVKARYWAVYGRKCQICGSRDKLHVHHKTYERFGNEALADLLGVCHTCHVEIHKFHRRNGGTLEQATNRYAYIRRSQKPISEQPMRGKGYGSKTIRNNPFGT